MNQPLLSILIPAHNEAGNIAPLCREIIGALTADPFVQGRFEIIVIDDASTDETVFEVSRVSEADERIRLIRNSEKSGMSASLRKGAEGALAAWIMTCDGDGQNDPADMPRLIGIAWSDGRNTPMLVGGVRTNRQDTLGKRVASRIANAVRRAVLHDGCPDTGCALKLMPREFFLKLPFFKGLHRFLPALAHHHGLPVAFTPVSDRPRQHGTSKSDFVGRAFRGLGDLVRVARMVRKSAAQSTSC